MPERGGAHGAPARDEAGAAVPGADNANIRLRVRPNCGQLFFVYAGVAGLPGMPGLRFLRESKLADRNLVMLRDPYNDDFLRGVGGGIDDLEALVRWQESCRRHFPHVSEIHCLGNSMGGYAAVLFACLLRARTAWAFGLRPAGGYGMMEKLRALLAGSESRTQYHLYYSPADDADRRCAERLATCPGVALRPLDEVSAEQSHLVLASLADTGRLGGLFPAFRAAGGERS
jgi:pimeloyl-ACP methyl ester carboxylesterase